LEEISTCEEGTRKIKMGTSIKFFLLAVLLLGFREIVSLFDVPEGIGVLESVFVGLNSKLGR